MFSRDQFPEEYVPTVFDTYGVNVMIEYELTYNVSMTG